MCMWRDNQDVLAVSNIKCLAAFMLMPLMGDKKHSKPECKPAPRERGTVVR